ncbi:MAG: hypothetical protein ACRDN8_06740, partial [Thermoleophilaceae bacterium]
GVLGADHHVPQLTRARRRAGPVHRERQDVGGPVDPPVAPVLLADLLGRDERDGQVALGHPGRRERRLCRRAKQGLLPGDDLDVDQAFFRAGRSSGACVSAYSL